MAAKDFEACVNKTVKANNFVLSPDTYYHQRDGKVYCCAVGAAHLSVNVKKRLTEFYPGGGEMARLLCRRFQVSRKFLHGVECGLAGATELRDRSDYGKGVRTGARLRKKWIEPKAQEAA